MNVTLTSLEALILKATHESLPCPDAAALEAFCAVMKDSPEGPQLAAQALAARIHSTNMREAMLALSLVDRCMRRGDAIFHAEVGKFRFLNEMIKLVSPKYLADRTAPEVRTRVLQLLHAWSLEYPKESKFKVAYEMLKNQGVVKETPPPLPPEEGGPSSRSRAKNVIFDDEEKSKLLQKLLQSKKPEDIQHANRLIKTMVREEERRNEVSSQRAMEVAAARDSAHLLNDMLEYAETEAPSTDEEQIMHELHTMCTRMRPPLQQAAALAANDTNAESLNEVLGVIDLIYEVQVKYQHYINRSKPTDNETTTQPTQAQTNNDALLDFAGANSYKNHHVPKTSAAKNNAMDELGDIFSTESGSNAHGDAAVSAEPLKPVNLMCNDDVDLLGEKPKTEGWNELDSLGEQLLKQSLPDNARRGDSFNATKAKKIPMNALTSPKHEPPTNGAILDLDFFTNRPQPEPKSPETSKPVTSQNDDVMVDITTEPCSSSTNDDGLILDLGTPVDRKYEETLESKADIYINDTEKKISNTKACEVKPLTDINVTLESVTPSKVLPLTAFEEEGGVTVVLHFCIDKPRSDVNVIVVSTTSRNKLPIADYKFQSVLPKGCKCRLLTPSGTSLPAYNPFLPPPALTQVMLIARPPASAPIGLKFVITYTCDDDTCSEMGEVKQLPLDDI